MHCIGFYGDAVKEYKGALQVAEAREDTIGSAVAHRMVGECLCALGKYKDALFHQNLHLQVHMITIHLVVCNEGIDHYHMMSELQKLLYCLVHQYSLLVTSVKMSGLSRWYRAAQHLVLQLWRDGAYNWEDMFGDIQLHTAYKQGLCGLEFLLK